MTDDYAIIVCKNQLEKWMINGYAPSSAFCGQWSPNKTAFQKCMTAAAHKEPIWHQIR